MILSVTARAARFLAQVSALRRRTRVLSNTVPPPRPASLRRQFGERRSHLECPAQYVLSCDKVYHYRWDPVKGPGRRRCCRVASNAQNVSWRSKRRSDTGNFFRNLFATRQYMYSDV